VNKKIKIILQTRRLTRIRELLTHRFARNRRNPGRQASLISSIAKRQRGPWRAVIAPPELPADRIKTLRDAFNLHGRDPEFIADIQRLNVDSILFRGKRCKT